MMNESLLRELREIPDLTVTENEPMNLHTTFKIGGPARLFADAHTAEAVLRAHAVLASFDIAPFLLGNGSNILVSDSGINGAVLKISCNKITVSENSLTAEAGASFTAVAAFAQRHALSGLEFAYGIPGTVGGAVVMNAGAYGGEVSYILTQSICLTPDNTLVALPHDRHNFGYRTSFYKSNPSYIVLSANFALKPDSASEISARMRDILSRRQQKQPLAFPSAGSVFKRPPGYFAGALVEQCGLKGFSIGGAQVSEKHAGFIINTGEATCSDVCKLIEHIQDTVFNATGISLECEICRI